MKKVCLIDDDSIYIMLVKRLISLNNLSNEVSEYKDGYEAFQALQKLHANGEALPDVIFLDLNMPIWDGWDFLDEFVKLDVALFPEIYIVTSSSHSLDLEKIASYSIVKRKLSKPLKLDDLVSILSEAN
jgi:CheY-like chemotaxis protein